MATRTFACECDQRGVDGEREFDGQLGRDHARQDQRTLEQQLPPVPRRVRAACKQAYSDWVQTGRDTRRIASIFD